MLLPHLVDYAGLQRAVRISNERAHLRQLQSYAAGVPDLRIREVRCVGRYLTKLSGSRCAEVLLTVNERGRRQGYAKIPIRRGP